ncbi:hypothetical protein DL96DRAFT_1670739 [Flagelloscypha sp. PMI_526]|nr:hypothetical protein DL96DRAFT_1670739 [Flagelloscypha sp. PMI_526]
MSESDIQLNDERSQEQISKDNELSLKLTSIIEDATKRAGPLMQNVRKHIETELAKDKEEQDEAKLTDNVKPLLEQAEKILNETNGSIRGADPDNRLSNKAQRNFQDHKATPEEQRLAEALKNFMVEIVQEVDWAKDKLDSFPKAKKNLGPLLDALGQPITQIIGAVGLLLAGVLNLLGNLLKGLGLDGLLKGLIGATGLDKIFKGLGFDKWFGKGSII